MAVSVCVCLSVGLSRSMCVCGSEYLFLSGSVSQYVCLFVCLSGIVDAMSPNKTG